MILLLILILGPILIFSTLNPDFVINKPLEQYIGINLTIKTENSIDNIQLFKSWNISGLLRKNNLTEIPIEIRENIT